MNKQHLELMDTIRLLRSKCEINKALEAGEDINGVTIGPVIPNASSARFSKIKMEKHTK